MKHALVTGAGGFVGGRLCQRLQDLGVTVTALHRTARPGNWSSQVVCDLAVETPDAAAIESVDTVFHLAGHAHAESDAASDALHQRTSVGGTERLLSALGVGARRLVYFSSVKAMGESTAKQGIDETTPPTPSTAYGRARLDAEQRVLTWNPGVVATVLRLPLVYGPGSRGNLQRMLRSIRAGRMPLLPDLDNRRSMIHVDDVCDAALACIEVPTTGGQVYLLSDGPGYSTREIQLSMFRALGRAVPRWHVPALALAAAARAGDLLRSLGWRQAPFHGEAWTRLSESASYRSDRARHDFGFAPSRTLDDGLREMVAASKDPEP